MDSFTLKPIDLGNAKIIEIQGYFADEAGEALDRLVDDVLRAGTLRIVLDFTACAIISSPGIAALMDTTLKITEDFQGKVALCGLDDLQRKVLNMAGIIAIAPAGASRDAAIALV